MRTRRTACHLAAQRVKIIPGVALAGNTLSAMRVYTQVRRAAATILAARTIGIGKYLIGLFWAPAAPAVVVDITSGSFIYIFFCVD